MNPKMKDMLKKLYQAPEPAGKRAFIRTIGPQPLDLRHMLCTQASYISKWEWILSVIVFGTAVLMSWFFESAAFCVLLAMMPLLAAAGVLESVRSIIYGMDELEKSARFSLKCIVLARMGIVGIENLILTLISALFVQGELLQTMLYLIVPYLITVSGSFFIVRAVSGRGNTYEHIYESMYACMGSAFAVSCGAAASIRNYSWIYQEQFQIFWAGAAILLLGMTFRESRRIMQFMECYD